jgi:hypothetical protein
MHGFRHSELLSQVAGGRDTTAGSLLGRVMFLEALWMLCRLFGFWCSATVHVSSAGYIMLQYSLISEQPKNAFEVTCGMR